TVDDVLTLLDAEFERLYEGTRRQSIAPKRLLRASLLQAFYPVRSERQLMEQIDYNLRSAGSSGSASIMRYGTIRLEEPRPSAQGRRRRFSHATIENRHAVHFQHFTTIGTRRYRRLIPRI